MNIAYPAKASGEPAKAAAQQEASMEDIFASIRRIIAEDQALFVTEEARAEVPGYAPGGPAAGEPAREATSPAGESPTRPSRPPAASGGAPDHAAPAQAAANAGAIRGPAAAPSGAPASQGDEAPLTSPRVATAASEAFRTLAATRLLDNSETLASLARDAIRPLVAEWLDAHLPALVERLVKAEIERIAGARSGSDRG